MTFVPGQPIEDVAHAGASERNRVAALLFELFMIELFELRLVQTDPNFANYQYNAKTGQLVLLDFGASRRFKAALVRGYRDLLAGAIAGDRPSMVKAAESIGYHLGPNDSAYRQTLLDLADIALVPLIVNKPYDFGRSPIPRQLMQRIEPLRNNSTFWQVPPIDVAYIHRKIGGLFMLATRLDATINVHELLLPWLDQYDTAL
jgi:hypothetical protein